MRCVSESPFFFDLGKDRLFAVHHRPPAGEPRRGLVVCPALAEERLWAHRVYVGLARELAAQGFAVLRFDFRGEGDSDLDFEEATLESRVEDALRAAAVLLEREPGLQRCFFLGHRVGCAVAARAVTRAAQLAEGLIAWDPIENGATYFMQWLRSTLASQMVATGRAPTRAVLVKSLEEGRTVTIDGYGVTPRLYRDLTSIEWRTVLKGVPCPTLVVEGACEPPFWRQTPRLQLRAAVMTERSLQWLREQGS